MGHNVAVSLLKGELNGGVVVQVKEEECLAAQYGTEDGVRSSLFPPEGNSGWFMPQRNLVDSVTFQVVDSQSSVIRPQSQQILQVHTYICTYVQM